MKVNVFFGGRSPEHDVSVSSALNVINSLDRRRHRVEAVYISAYGQWRLPVAVDGPTGREELLGMCAVPVPTADALLRLCREREGCVAFPVLHGPYGEDGTIQGLFEMLGVPYVGNGVLASAAAMDKAVMKDLFARAGIPQADYRLFTRAQAGAAAEGVERDIGYPCYVKPANMGSSVGISRCEGADALDACVRRALLYDDRIVIEREIVGREVLLALTGDDEVRCSPPGVWRRPAAFFSYDDKYMDDGLTPMIPADVTDEVYREMCALGARAFRALDGSGLMRADFFVTGEGRVYLNEVNTMPGFTPHSMFPLLAMRGLGVDMPGLLDRLIGLGLRRHERRQALSNGAAAGVAI